MRKNICYSGKTLAASLHARQMISAEITVASAALLSWLALYDKERGAYASARVPYECLSSLAIRGELGGPKELHDFMMGFYNRWLPMLDLPVPVISVLQGDYIGVAPVFALAPDIAIADETLNLQVTFAGLALYPGMALPGLLLRKVSRSRTALMAIAGEAVNGREAERLGLVERCVAPGKAFEEALRVARNIAAAGSETVRLLKKTIGLKKEDLAAELGANALQ